MLDLTPEQRQLLLDKVPDAAHLALGALVFGPFLGDAPLSLVTVAVGMALWALVFVFCFLLGGRKR